MFKEKGKLTWAHACRNLCIVELDTLTGLDDGGEELNWKGSD
jgi:hypothetical protein